MFCTWAHHVTAEQMLNGNNIPTAVQKDNQTETSNDKQDKTVLKSNEASSHSLSKSDSNILMAFPLRQCCCCFLFLGNKTIPQLCSLAFTLVPRSHITENFPKAPLVHPTTSSLCFPRQSTDNLLNITFFTCLQTLQSHLAPLSSSFTKPQTYWPSFCSLNTSRSFLPQGLCTSCFHCLPSSHG